MPPHDRSAASDPALPRLLVDTAQILAGAAESASGALWKLDDPARDLDSNVIALPPGREIAWHVGPDLDVLMHVLAGGGRLRTDADDVALTPGALIWLPRRSGRAIVAGPDGLRYLTVHRRRPALGVGLAPAEPRT